MERFKSISDILNKVKKCPWCDIPLKILIGTYTYHTISYYDKFVISKHYVTGSKIIIDIETNDVSYVNIGGVINYNSFTMAIGHDFFNRSYGSYDCSYRYRVNINTNKSKMKVSSIIFSTESLCNTNSADEHISYFRPQSTSRSYLRIRSKNTDYSTNIFNKLYIDDNVLKEKFNNILLLA